MTSILRPTTSKSDDALTESSADILVLESGYAERHYWKSVWQYRELFVILAWRDIAVRYKQTVVGLGWAIIRPLLTTIVFTIVFGGLAKLPSDGNVPYPVLVLAGMMAWSLFSSTLNDASNSVVGNGGLISKVFFPRIIVPIASTMVSLVDFLINLGLMIVFMAYYRIMPGWQIAFLPLFISLCVLASIGPGFLFAAYNVKYRDFRFIVPFALQLGIYVSPVGFSSSIVPERWLSIYYLNPMVGIIDGFRWCLLGGDSPIYWPGFGMSLCIVASFLWLGVRVFRRTERSFADVM